MDLDIAAPQLRPERDQRAAKIGAFLQGGLGRAKFVEIIALPRFFHDRAA